MDKKYCKRKIKRLNISFSDGTTGYNGISSDFSCNGLFIRTRKVFKEGTVLKMMLDIDDKTIPLIGIVIRSVEPRIVTKKSGIGIALTLIPPEYKNFLKELYGN